MSERSVSDLVFRDFVPRAARRPAAEREAAVREELEELVNLRAARPAPRVLPAAAVAARRSAPQQRLQ
jgi:hypothetical protein